MSRFLFLLLPLLSACSYCIDGYDNHISVSVPYAIGDFEGELTNAIIWELSRSPEYSYTQDEGRWTIITKVLGTNNERIGFRYDRDDKSGERRKNIVGTENRKYMSVQVTVVNNRTGKKVLGPYIIKEEVDYDYADQNSLRDLSFVDSEGERQTSIAFSLGQLDTVAAAGEDALYPLYQKIAKRIVEGLDASDD